MSTKNKIVVACLNGGGAFGVWPGRTYMSDVMKKAAKATKDERKFPAIWRWARGSVWPTPSKFFRRSVRGVINYARKHANGWNALILLGKSSGAYNWITHLNEEPEVFKAYKYVYFVAVDTNHGPGPKNRNEQVLDLKAHVDWLSAYYTTDENVGGYRINPKRLKGKASEFNAVLHGYNHHNCCKSARVLAAVEKAFRACDNALRQG